MKKSSSYLVRSKADNPLEGFLSANSTEIETFFSLAPHVPLTMQAKAGSGVTSTLEH